MDVSTLVYLQGVADPLRETLQGLGTCSIVFFFFSFVFMLNAPNRLWVSLVILSLFVSALAFLGASIIPDSGAITMMLEQIQGLG